ncbi:dTDP-4-dehydrorhamnose reductase [Labrys wisconsinensis]|uniref:dTDP-4-dehydrorhamnose reductase n=1 Tax=Labrys wisconsinensis TaxID=425677 RepID=A0ABU0JQT1_9HYPH|nr:dTDP-4-dehydrorhamnose reductase [Labrys wisconsinensis]
MIDILVTGGAGQVGLELQRLAWPEGVRLHAPDRATFDLTDPGSVAALFASRSFAAVINPAAYTAVDKAQGEVAAAFLVNAQGPALLAEASARAGIPLVQVSTDYVFDGTKADPYVETDPVGPLGVYGASKLAGELAVRSGNPRSVVLRTAWVVSARRANFLKTMLRLAAERPALRVVDDQRGCPTSAADIARALETITLRLIEDRDAPTGLYHFVNAGEASWCGLARAVLARSAARGGPHVPVEAIATADYPTPARRPANSRLATAKIRRDFAITPRPWQDAIHDIVDELVPATPLPGA